MTNFLPSVEYILCFIMIYFVALCFASFLHCKETISKELVFTQNVMQQSTITCIEGHKADMRLDTVLPAKSDSDVMFC